MFLGILITGNAIFKYILVVFSKFSSVFVFCRCFYRVLFKMFHVEHSQATHSVYFFVSRGTFFAAISISFMFHVKHFLFFERREELIPIFPIDRIILYYFMLFHIVLPELLFLNTYSNLFCFRYIKNAPIMIKILSFY